MKRFYTNAEAGAVDGGWQVMLDGRGVKTQRGAPQIVASTALAEALAAEWAAQGAEIDLASFRLRDLADYAIDVIAPHKRGTIGSIIAYAEGDTLCYRADPDEPLYHRQRELWEPLLSAAENRLGIRFERISGIVHRDQPEATLARLRLELESLDPFALSALNAMTSLAHSLVIGLAALEVGADAEALFAAANAEEDWQAEQWGWEWTAEERRVKRLADFANAMEFARLARV